MDLDAVWAGVLVGLRSFALLPVSYEVSPPKANINRVTLEDSLPSNHFGSVQNDRRVQVFY